MIRIIGGRISGAGRDGVHVVGNSAEIYIEGTIIENNCRDNIHHKPSKTDMFMAGLDANIPEETLIRAYKEMLASRAESDEQKVQTLKSIGFEKWVSRGANLATIGSLIMQVFSQ